MTIDLLSPPASGIGRLIRRGISWWLGELAELLPRRLTSWVGRRGEWTARIEPGPNGTLRWSPDPARQSAIRHGGAVAIGLDRALIFESVVELPLAAEASLRQILQHQIDRLVPLDAAETAFQYRIEPRAADAETLRVRVHIAKRATIERALAMARDVGLDPKRIIVADAQRESGLPALWQADDAVGSQRARRRRLEIAAMILAATGYALYVHRLDRMRDGLEARLAAATPAAAAVRALGGEAERMDAAEAFFARRRNETEALGAVDELTRMVPLDSWLTRLSIRGREVEIAGYSPHASDIVARVEASAIFRNPQFRSPITLAPDGKRERFDLTFEIRPRATP
jgi:general secretion pathway protein L